ncbi:hypothetical protein BC332_29190 [Capsicum chinense]|nr:hypothetical protein BC332_29190 [Capsicum chinense]
MDEKAISALNSLQKETGKTTDFVGESSAEGTMIVSPKRRNALQSEVLNLREEMFLVDAGLGTPKICMQDETTGVPINRATRCLEDGPNAAERKLGSGFSTGRGTGDDHLKAHHDLQETPERPEKETRLGVKGSIVPAAS